MCSCGLWLTAVFRLEAGSSLSGPRLSLSCLARWPLHPLSYPGLLVLGKMLFVIGGSCTFPSCLLSCFALFVVQGAVSEYIGWASWAFDERAVRALRSSHELVQEAFLQVTDGHVSRWANYRLHEERTRECSRATIGCLNRLEYLRQVHDPPLLYPRGLVPDVLLPGVCTAACFSYP